MSLMPVIYTSLVIFLTLLVFLVILSWIAYKAKARGRKLPHEKYEQEPNVIQFVMPVPARVSPPTKIQNKKIEAEPIILKSSSIKSRPTHISEKPMRKSYAPRFSTLNETNFRDTSSTSGKRYSQTNFHDMKRVTILNNPINIRRSHTQSESVTARDASKLNIIKYYTDNPDMDMISMRAAGY
jgi:hypothetical protein